MRLLRTIAVSMIPLLSAGCVSALHAYGVVIIGHAPPGEQMADTQIEEVRALVRSIAERRGLVPHESYPQPPPPGFSIRDHYGAGQRTIALLISEGRDYLKIYVTDWESAGEPSLWQRAIENDLLTGLAQILPGWIVEPEYEDLGFWSP